MANGYKESYMDLDKASIESIKKAFLMEISSENSFNIDSNLSTTALLETK